MRARWRAAPQTRKGVSNSDHDGTYVDDYAFTNAGDLDEWNGMTMNGVYGYDVTDTFPWVMRCFKGTPDPSFRKMM